MTWTLDNWLYTTFNTFRSRWTPSGVVKETSGSTMAPSGALTQDDDGKQWYLERLERHPGATGSSRSSTATSTCGPDAASIGDARIPWGAPVTVADMQGGMGIDPDARRLARSRRPPAPAASSSAATGCRRTCTASTATASRSRAWSGACIPRTGKALTLRPQRRRRATSSSSPPTRTSVPVDQKTAPDGTLYIVDMYHGIVQERQWSGPGTYIRARIEQYDLDKVIHYGRIWRLVYDGVKRGRRRASIATRPCRA